MVNNKTIDHPRFVLGSSTFLPVKKASLEDRAFSGEISRKDNQKFLLGIIADGAGPVNLAGKTAQLAIDTVVKSIKASNSLNIPLMIKLAIEEANSEIYNTNLETGRDSFSTIAVAIIFEGRLFIGNVGNSRVYWVQTTSSTNQGKILQLSRDHTYFNLFGGDPHGTGAEKLANSLGMAHNVEVDLGFYLKGNDVEKAYELGLGGLPLQAGDAVLLCSDGLITKNSSQSQLIANFEILDLLSQQIKPDQAAACLIKLAKDREPEDDIAVVTMQFVHPQYKPVPSGKNTLKNSTPVSSSKWWIFPVLVIILAVILLLFYKELPNFRSILPFTYHESPNPTFTPILTLPQPNVSVQPSIPSGKTIVEASNSHNASVKLGEYIQEGETITSGNGAVSFIVSQANGANSRLVLFPDSTIVYSNTATLEPKLLSGGVYLQSGAGISYVSLDSLIDGLRASIAGSQMVVLIDGDEIWIYCLEGRCLFEPHNANPIRVPENTKQAISISTQETSDAQEISATDLAFLDSQCPLNCFVLALPTMTTRPQLPATQRVITQIPTNKFISNPATSTPTWQPYPTNTSYVTPLPTKTPISHTPTLFVTKTSVSTTKPTKRPTSTRVPTTPVPQTEIPPTDAPTPWPTDIPWPTDAPQTQVPTVEVPPTKVPPTELPPSPEAPTARATSTPVPPTKVPKQTPSPADVYQINKPVFQMNPTQNLSESLDKKVDLLNKQFSLLDFLQRFVKKWVSLPIGDSQMNIM